MDSGAILTAVIAASAATLAAVVTKDAKISEFRQQWIDALRDDVADLCGAIVTFYWANRRFNKLPPYSEDDTDQVGLEVIVALNREVSHLEFRIKLRLDPQKAESTALVTAIDKLVGLASKGETTFTVLDASAREVLTASQTLLDKAWIRVRHGESRFQVAIWMAFSSLVLSLIVAFIHWIAQHSITVHQHIPWI